MARVIPLRKAPRAKLTVPQEKFWLVLQNPRVAQRDAKEKEKGFADTFEAGLGFV